MLITGSANVIGLLGYEKTTESQALGAITPALLLHVGVAVPGACRSLDHRTVG